MSTLACKLVWRFKRFEDKTTGEVLTCPNKIAKGQIQTWNLDQLVTCGSWPEDKCGNGTTEAPSSIGRALDQAISLLAEYDHKDVLLGTETVCILACEILDLENNVVASIEPVLLQVENTGKRKEATVTHIIQKEVC